MNIIVTGGCGFIGRVVVRMLLEKGHRVKIIDSLLPQVHGPGLLTTPTPVRLEDNWFVSVGTASRVGGEFWAGTDAVVHLAAEVGVGQSQYEPARYVSANALETAALWERIVATGSVSAVVVASSMSVYGEGLYTVNGNAIPGGGFERPDPINPKDWDEMHWHGVTAKGIAPMQTVEEKRVEPASVYAMSKYDTEMYSLLQGRAYEVSTAALRFFNCLGPEQALSNPYTGVLAAFGCRALNDRPGRINEDGRQSRDFIYVDDVAAAVVHALELRLSGAYNVCTGIATTVGELSHMLTTLAKSPPGEVVGEFRVGDTRHCYGSPAKLEATGWKAKVSVEEAVARTFAWMKTQPIPKDRHDAATSEMRERGLLK